ncbi:MAG: hypothetical protein ACK56F_26705, partial [bacterium]
PAEVSHQAWPLPGGFQLFWVFQLEPERGSVGSQLQRPEPHKGVEGDRPVLGPHSLQVTLPVIVLLPGHKLHHGAYPLVRQEVRQPPQLLGVADSQQDPAVMGQCLAVIDHPPVAQDLLT